MILRHLLPIFIALQGIALYAAEPIPGEISASKLMVRSQPGRQYEVLCTLKKGDKITIVDHKGDWLKILAPKESVVWVKENALKDAGKKDTDKVTAACDVYAGPASIFSAYGKLPTGQAVTVLERKRSWIRIEATSGITAWVHSHFVKVPEQFRKQVPSQDTAKKLKQDEEKSKTKSTESTNPKVPGDASPGSIPAKAPKDYKIHWMGENSENKSVVLVGVGKPVNKIGVVVPTGDKNLPWKYVLAVGINNTFYPLYYINDGVKDIDSFAWRKVRIKGTQNWVKNWPRPLLKVETLEAYIP